MVDTKKEYRQEGSGNEEMEDIRKLTALQQEMYDLEKTETDEARKDALIRQREGTKRN